MVEINVSSMSLWPFAGSLELTGIVATAMGADGVEHICSKAGMKQLESGKIGDAAHINRGHFSFRSEAPGWDSMVHFLRQIPRPGPMAAALITFATMPTKYVSEMYLNRLQQVLGRDLPVVIYPDSLLGMHPLNLPFKDVSLQITQELLDQHQIKTPAELERLLSSWRVHPCYDGQHSAGLPNDIRDYVQSEAREVHVRTGFDLKNAVGVDVGVLKKCPKLEAVVIESSSPISAFRLIRQVREIVG